MSEGHYCFALHTAGEFLVYLQRPDRPLALCSRVREQGSPRTWGINRRCWEDASPESVVAWLSHWLSLKGARG